MRAEVCVREETVVRQGTTRKKQTSLYRQHATFGHVLVGGA